MTKYSLFELNEYVKQVLALNFTESLWVSCELSQIKESRGNVYLELVEQDDDTKQVKAKIGAVIWNKTGKDLRKRLGPVLTSLLTNGSKVLLRVQVKFEERYGLKLVIEDIDPSYTIGQMEMERQKIVDKLKADGVIDKNSLTTLPPVIQRIAVISASTAAGFADFEAQIDSNGYGYDIHVHLFPAAMQGHNTESEVLAALQTISLKHQQYDCVAIVRGGGSKLDLASFDNYKIGHAIASFPIPVITGIGHEIDSTVADIVSYSSLKTPTAVAAYVLDRNLQFESEISKTMQWIAQIAKQKVEHHRLSLEQLQQVLTLSPLAQLRNEKQRLTQMHQLLKQAAKYSLKELQESVSYTEKIIHLADPETIMKRGYAVIKTKTGTVASLEDLQADDQIEIQFHKGAAEATVTQIKK